MSDPESIYPLRFAPYYLPKPWGGRGLEPYDPALPPGKIGEIWPISAQDEGFSVVANGPWSGTSLPDLSRCLGRQLIGSNPPEVHFPLMVRYVCAEDNLSIQLHPTAEFASEHGMRSGKDEAWFVLEADPDGAVYAGARAGVSQEDLAGAIGDKRLLDMVVRHPVQAGDCIYVQAGTIHGICKGVTLIEICETSNVTYRLYDYDRDRGIDYRESEDNLRGDQQPKLSRWTGGNGEEVLCSEPTMALAVVSVQDAAHCGNLDGHTFNTLSVLEGEGSLVWSGGTEALQVGDSLLLPATLGEYEIRGRLRLLKTYVPQGL